MYVQHSRHRLKVKRNWKQATKALLSILTDFLSLFPQAIKTKERTMKMFHLSVLCTLKLKIRHSNQPVAIYSLLQWHYN